jgi:hypothetical protein
VGLGQGEKPGRFDPLRRQWATSASARSPKGHNSPKAVVIHPCPSATSPRICWATARLAQLLLSFTHTLQLEAARPLLATTKMPSPCWPSAGRAFKGAQQRGGEVWRLLTVVDQPSARPAPCAVGHQER